MKKMSKRKWDWIKYWGHHYQVIFPNKSNQNFILYHHKLYDVKSWNQFFKEA